jgi:hypothetical protein
MGQQSQVPGLLLDRTHKRLARRNIAASLSVFSLKLRLEILGRFSSLNSGISLTIVRIPIMFAGIRSPNGWNADVKDADNVGDPETAAIKKGGSHMPHCMRRQHNV